MVSKKPPKIKFKPSLPKCKPPQDKDLSTIRKEIRNQLPFMFEQTLNAYHEILNITDPEDQKLIQARHNAAKTALGHIQQLVRLGDWALMDMDLQQNPKDELAKIIALAEQERNAQEKTLSDQEDD